MMRMRAAVAAAVVAVCGLSASAQTLYVTEPFSYTNAQNLSGQSGGTGWGGSWAPDALNSASYTTSTTGQTYLNLTTSGNSVSATSSASIYTRTVSAAASPTGNDYWVSFLIRTNAGTNQYAGIDLGGNRYIGKASVDATYGIAVTGNAADSTNPTLTPSTSGADLLVAHFRGDNNIDLYVNPTSLGGAAPGVASASAALSTPVLAGTALRLFSGSINGAPAPSTIFSDIRIGDSFAAVTPVPEPLTVGLLAAAGLGLTRLRRWVV